MKSRRFLIWLSALVAASTLSHADPVTVTGVADNGEGGIYSINGQTYWWMCIEPETPALNTTINAQLLSFADAWDRQNTERLAIFQSDPSFYYNTVIPKQVAVMSYVLDTYLPWSTLAGASGRFVEQDTDFENDDTFHNAFFALQNFLAETHGKVPKTDFTDMSDYQDYFAGIGTPAADARSGIFQAMLADVASKDPNFFDTYVAQHGYMVVNSLLPKNDPDNWQDGLIIFSYAPVPEPGAAMLIASCGLAFLLRRRRLRA